MNTDVTQKFDNSRKWLLGALAVVFLRALPNLRYPIGRDQATFCVIGQGLLRGQLLYRDLWDNKPPGIFYIYALIVKIFGPVMWGVGAVDIIWLLVISLCIFCFARRSFGAPAAALAIVFNAFRHCKQGYIHAAQPETFMMLFVFIIWFLLHDSIDAKKGDEASSPKARSRFVPVGMCFAAGLLLGAVFWIKYNSVAFFPFLLVLPFVDFSEIDPPSSRVQLGIPWQEWFRKMAIVGAGFALVVAGLLAYFYISGAWPALKEVQFEVLPRYGAMAFGITTNNYVIWALRQSQNHLGLWSEVVAALTLLIAWWRREIWKIAPAMLFALAGYLSVAMQVRFHHPYYYETCYPFFALFWGYICVKTYEGFKYLREVFARRRLTLARALLWLVLIGLASSLMPEEAVRVVQQYGFLRDWWRNPDLSYEIYWWQLPIEKLSGQIHVLDYLKQNAAPNDQVYVWGTAPLINFLSERQNPSRFVSNLALLSLWAPDRWRQELVDTLEQKRPRYIVVERDDAIPAVSFTGLDSEEYLRIYPGLANLLTVDYQMAEKYPDFKIYRLK